MNEIFSSALMMIGATFALLAAAGVVRMPDLFTRIQAATKASTLGIGCIVVAVAVHFGELGITTRALAIIVFVFLTAPVAAHMIARAAYFVGVPLWEETVIDELHGQYDRRTHKLARPDDPFAVLPMTVDLRRISGQTVLVGYGRVGGRIGEALLANDVSVVVVEDSRNGLLASLGAGMPTLITTSTYTKDEDFKGAAKVVPELGDPPKAHVTLEDLQAIAA